MNGNDTYGPTPIKLETFDNIVTISGAISKVIEKTFDGRPRWVATIDEDWTLIVNDTSYRVIKKTYGPDSDGWLGRPITVYKGKLYRNGNEQDGVCVRIPDEAPAPAENIDAANAELRASGADKLDDDIPF